MEKRTSEQRSRGAAWWAELLVSVGALIVIGWIMITAGNAVVHGHPLYVVLLALTVVAAAVALWRSLARHRPRTGWRLAGWIALLALAVAWIGILAWLRPFSAVEPALSALQSDERVTVTESASQIVMTPVGSVDETGVLFQPGARVDARAYAATLRSHAEAGHVVVIEKQPLGIAFLSLGSLDDARSAAPEVSQWVVGGHSLGGTVAALQADSHDDATAPVAGLLLYASYPAGDISDSLTAPVLSLSAEADGLATPEQIGASRTDLPESTAFVTIPGASHAQFGDYGPQPGDGQPTITNDAARAEVITATSGFLTEIVSP